MLNNRTIEDIESFNSQGFVVIKNYLDKIELPVIETEVEKTIATNKTSTCIRPNNTLLSLRWNDYIVGKILSSPYRVSRIINAVGAKDLKWISGYISIKDPHSPPLWWHQDWWCWQHDVSFKKVTSQVALLCYLKDTDVENGALRVLPGSHHKSTTLHAFLPEAHADASNEMEAEHVALQNNDEQITLNLNAGDAVIIDYRLLHGTHENSTSTRRDCIMLTFTPSWKDLPADIKGHLISHYSLPSENEESFNTPFHQDLMPTFEGKRKDLFVDRMPPASFMCQ